MLNIGTISKVEAGGNLLKGNNVDRDLDLLNHSRVRVLRPVDSSASQSARTSSLWNEERNQCAREGFLLSVLLDPAERVEILENMIEAETSNIPFNQWRLHPVSAIPVQSSPTRPVKMHRKGKDANDDPCHWEGN